MKHIPFIESRWRIVLAAMIAGAILVGILAIARTKDRGIEVRGNSKSIVETVDFLEHEEQEGLTFVAPDLNAFFGEWESIFLHNTFGYVYCHMIVRTEIQHFIFEERENCPTSIVDELPRYDLIIAYNDSVCKHPPRLIVDMVNNQYRFVIDKQSERGGCDNVSQPDAIGIRLRLDLLKAANPVDSHFLNYRTDGLVSGCYCHL